MAPPADPEPAKPLLVVLPPAFAGGSLGHFNALLWACAWNQRNNAAGPVRVYLDQELIQEKDRDLFVLNVRGDPVRIPGTPNGILSEHERRSLTAALVDTLPPDSSTKERIQEFLPAPESLPVNSSKILWKNILGKKIDFVSELPKMDNLGRQIQSDLRQEASNLWRPPELIWLGPSQSQTLSDLGLSPQQALGGERSLKRTLSKSRTTALDGAIRALQDDVQAHLLKLEKLVRSEDLGLFGAWARLRRDQKRSLQDFHRRVDRSMRSRHGIQASRLHGLAQSLRPGDKPQQEHFSLLAAVLLFRIRFDSLEPAIRILGENLDSKQPVFLNTETTDKLEHS